MEKDKRKASPLIIEGEGDAIDLGLHSQPLSRGVRIINCLSGQESRLRSYGSTYTIPNILEECDDPLL